MGSNSIAGGFVVGICYVVEDLDSISIKKKQFQLLVFYKLFVPFFIYY